MSSDETYYKVTAEVELTVRSRTPEWAISVTLAAIGGSINAAGGVIQAVMTDQAKASAEKIEYDPEEMAKMERWLETVQNEAQTHPFTD